VNKWLWVLLILALLAAAHLFRYQITSVTVGDIGVPMKFDRWTGRTHIFAPARDGGKAGWSAID
jgi:hypothetical protein